MQLATGPTKTFALLLLCCCRRCRCCCVTRLMSKASQSASFSEMMKKKAAPSRLYLLLLCCCRRCCCCCVTSLGFLTPARVSSQAKVHRLSRWSRACVVLALQPTAALPTDQLPHRRNFPYRGPSQSRLGRWIPST